MNKFFNIIIPVYNSEKYLSRCIASVLCQNYTKYSVVLVDDGSTDSSGNIADDYAAKHKNIHVLHQQNQGQIIARTNGIQFVLNHFDNTNSFFMFVDSDDELKPNVLSSIADILETQHCDLLIFGIEIFNSFNGSVNNSMRGVCEGTVTDKSELYKIVLFDYQYNSLCRKVIASSLVTTKSFDDYSHIRNAEDLIQSLDYYRAAQKVVFTKEIFYRYHVNPASVTRAVNIDNYPVDSVVRSLTWDFVKSEGVWSESEMNSYASFLLKLIENKIKAVAGFDAPADKKIQLYQTMQSDAFYREILRLPLPHSRVISLFEQENYNALYRAVMWSRIRKKLRCGKKKR